jgi:Cysteine-rich CPCC
VDPALSDDELVAQRLRWFAAYTSQVNAADRADSNYTCPCCGHMTLSEPGAYQICAECGWEDDGQDDHDSHIVRGGPNGSWSLDDARAVYVARGRACRIDLPPIRNRHVLNRHIVEFRFNV